MDIESSTKEKVEEYLNKWNTVENYVLQESSFEKLFHIISANRFERGVVLVDEVWDFEKL